MTKSLNLREEKRTGLSSKPFTLKMVLGPKWGYGFGGLVDLPVHRKVPQCFISGRQKHLSHTFLVDHVVTSQSHILKSIARTCWDKP